MSHTTSTIDLFWRQLQDYKRGVVDVQFSRYNDHAKATVHFVITFDHTQSTRPQASIMQDLDRLYDHLIRSEAFIHSMTQQSHKGIEFEIVMSDFAMMNPRPTFTISNVTNPVPIKFTAPEEKPKKIITIVKKVQTEVLIGYRDFTYLKKGNQSRPMLLSRNGVPWPRYAPLVASCNGDPFVTHDAPSVSCQCGIYAFNKPDHKEMSGNAQIWGEIALWGKVLICTDGYRAQYAYPQNIFVKDVGTQTVRAFRDAIEKEYGVPVHLVKEQKGKAASDIFANMINDWIKDHPGQIPYVD